MTFFANVPQAGQSLGNSRGKINRNFTNFNKIWSVNHIDFEEDQGTTGKHLAQQFPAEATASQKQTAAGEIAYYSKLVSSVARLTFREPNNGTERQWSGKFFKDQKEKDKLGGFIPLFGGLSLAFGFLHVKGNTALNVLFSEYCGSAFTSACHSILVTPANPPNQSTVIWSVSGIVGTGFSITTTFTGNIYFLAIGN